MPPDEPACTVGTAQTVLIRYEDLVRDPRVMVAEAVRRIAPDLPMRTDVTLPTFGDLHQFDPRFFRRGTTGTHRDEMPAELEELFWSYEDNREAMRRLGYARTGDEGLHLEGTPPMFFSADPDGNGLVHLQEREADE